jgi:hypothetical protein
VGEDEHGVITTEGVEVDSTGATDETDTVLGTELMDGTGATSIGLCAPCSACPAPPPTGVGTDEGDGIEGGTAVLTDWPSNAPQLRSLEADWLSWSWSWTLPEAARRCAEDWRGVRGRLPEALNGLLPFELTERSCSFGEPPGESQRDGCDDTKDAE